MTLIVKGFSKQQVVSVEYIQSALNKLPSSHLVNLECIAFDPSRYYERSYVAPKPINYSAMGSYSKLPINHILIFNFRTPSEFLHVLYHEIGHHVFKHVLSSKERKLWVTDISRNNAYVTDYASTNANEDFAECYACYHVNLTLLSAIPTKYRFIRQFHVD